MTKVMFILFPISRGLEYCSVEHTSIYENSELKVFKNIDVLGELSSIWSNDLLEINVYKTIEYCW